MESKSYSGFTKLLCVTGTLPLFSHLNIARKHADKKKKKRLALTSGVKFMSPTFHLATNEILAETRDLYFTGQY